MSAQASFGRYDRGSPDVESDGTGAESIALDAPEEIIERELDRRPGEPSFKFTPPPGRILELRSGELQEALDRLVEHAEVVYTWDVVFPTWRFRGTWMQGHEVEGAEALRALFALLWPERFPVAS